MSLFCCSVASYARRYIQLGSFTRATSQEQTGTNQDAASHGLLVQSSWPAKTCTLHSAKHDCWAPCSHVLYHSAQFSSAPDTPQRTGAARAAVRCVGDGLVDWSIELVPSDSFALHSWNLMKTVECNSSPCKSRSKE